MNKIQILNGYSTDTNEVLRTQLRYVHTIEINEACVLNKHVSMDNTFLNEKVRKILAGVAL